MRNLRIEECILTYVKGTVLEIEHFHFQILLNGYYINILVCRFHNPLYIYGAESIYINLPAFTARVADIIQIFEIQYSIYFDCNCSSHLQRSTTC